MTLDPQRTAVLGLHWQTNVIEQEGFFGDMLSDPVARSGVVERAVRFHQAALDTGTALFFTRFTIPPGEGALVRNTGFMRAVGEAQQVFRPDAPTAQLIPEMAPLSANSRVVDNQKLSGLASSELTELLVRQGVDTLLVTGVATNLTVEQTARHGTDLGFTVHVISDCTTAATPELHTASLANLDLTTAGCLTAAEALAHLR